MFITSSFHLDFFSSLSPFRFLFSREFQFSHLKLFVLNSKFLAEGHDLPKGFCHFPLRVWHIQDPFPGKFDPIPLYYTPFTSLTIPQLSLLTQEFLNPYVQICPAVDFVLCSLESNPNFVDFAIGFLLGVFRTQP